MQNVLLIVPCYNEEKRLDTAVFKAASPNIEFLFANDGSSDGTREMLDNLARESTRFKAFHAPENVGKANVIYGAYKFAEQNLNVNKYAWVGFWDADLATPLSAVADMAIYAQTFYESRGHETNAIWGSRVSRLGSAITRHAHRHYLGRMFVTVVSVLLGVKAYDSQCGAKLFRPAAAAIAFREPFLSRWIFDVEILLRIGETGVVEFPLLKWTDIPGSKIKIFREMFRVWRDILRIRARKIR